jgi:hypothetical protein
MNPESNNVAETWHECKQEWIEATRGANLWFKIRLTFATVRGFFHGLFNID